jgi:hypothetical protein
LTVIPVPVSPALEAYKQIDKDVSGYPSWYTTESDTVEGALRTAVTATIAGGAVEQWRDAPINISQALQLYQPTRVTIKEISVASKWSGSGSVYSDVDIKIKNSADSIIHEFKNVESDYEQYKTNYDYPNLDVTGQQQFYIQVYQAVAAEIGGTDLRTRNMTVTFELETSIGVHQITIRLQDEQGNLLYGSRARIGTITYDFPTGEGTIELPPGTYTIEAWATVGETTYTGSGSFTVPDDPYVNITLKPESWLPDWWWIPIAAVGGLTATYIIYKIIKGEKPSFIVVR